MFLPWPYFVFQLFKTTVGAFSILAIDSLLAIYSRKGDKYANSLRWNRQTGFLERLGVLWNSCQNRIPWKVYLLLILTLGMNILALVIPVLISIPSDPATKLSETKAIEMVVSRQLIFPDVRKTFQKFVTAVPLGDDNTIKLAGLINNTIPVKKFARVYTPRTSSYSVACNQASLRILHDDNIKQQYSNISNESCAPILVSFIGPFLPNLTSPIVKSLDNGLYNFSVPISRAYPNTEALDALRSGITIGVDGFTCPTGYVEADSVITSSRKLLYPPELRGVKCINSNGAIKDAAQIFKDRSELIDAMAVYLDLNPKFEVPILFSQYKITNNVVDMLTCTVLPPGNLRLTCFYQSVSVIVTTVPEKDPLIPTKGRQGEYGISNRYSFYTEIQQILSHVDGVPEKISTISMQKSVIELSEYLASLGQNVDTDWNLGNTYVVYDTQDIIRGFEIPVWVFAICCAVIALSMVLWVYTRFKSPIYRGSFHRNISRQIAKQSITKNTKAPFLMYFDMNSKELDGTPIIAPYAMTISEANTTEMSLPMTLDNMGGVPSDISLLSSEIVSLSMALPWYKYIIMASHIGLALGRPQEGLRKASGRPQEGLRNL
ncbi:hypothetical protein BGZ76_001628 [Entomortierella beljakovae]|nr:hypothetical protein BGZ76_001628 [Entomortierella beljakovae]